MLRQILIAGDSTVTNREPKVDENYESGVCYTGWGQMITLFLGIDYRVVNLAKSGLTTDSFRTEKHYDKLLSMLNEDDYVIFQFGHNDQKVKELGYNGGYRNNLINYINEIRARNANPILITPLARNTWNCIVNEYNDLLYDYSNTVISVANDMNVPVIDLHKYSKDWIIKSGRNGVLPFFYPGDLTHTNDYGAYFFAEFVAIELLKIIKPNDKIFDFRSLSPSNIPKFLYENSNEKLTKLEALKLVRLMGRFFSKAEATPNDKNVEIICAEQNGYLFFTDNLEDYILKSAFLNLIIKTLCCEDKKLQEVFYSKDNIEVYITRLEALEYLERYEESLNISKHRVKDYIKGC